MVERLKNIQFSTAEEAIRAYLGLGLRHETIVNFLERHHGINLSLRTLRRRLRRLVLKWHNCTNCSDERLLHAVREELASSGQSLGYRHVWHNLRVKHGISVSRAKVRHRVVQYTDYVEMAYERTGPVTRGVIV